MSRGASLLMRCLLTRLSLYFHYQRSKYDFLTREFEIERNDRQPFKRKNNSTRDLEGDQLIFKFQ